MNANSVNKNKLYELRYKAYEGALQILRSNHMSIQERKAAIFVRDEFEMDLRNGNFKNIFIKENK